MIITLANTKGGVGKTTIAVNLAVARSLSGRRILLVDGDPQATASLFTEIRREEKGDPGYELRHWPGDTLFSGINEARSTFEDIVIDVGGFDAPAMRAALVVSDRVLIPVGPRSFDLWAVERMQDLISAAREHNSSLIAQAFLNAADSQGSDNDQMGAAIREMPNLEFLPIIIGRRKAFANAAAGGLAVTEYRPRDRKAISEIMRLLASQFSPD